VEILSFVIEGHGEITREDDVTTPYRSVGAASVGGYPPEQTGYPSELTGRTLEIRAATALNERAEEMAQAIERELRRLMLGGGITVQADISFHSGSIILEGSVVLLCWAGRTALEPIRDELADCIKTITRRVVNRAINALNRIETSGPGPSSGASLGQMNVEVTSVPPPPTSAALSTAAPSPAVPQAQPQQQQLAQGGILQDQRWVLVFLGVLTVLVLILLADRLLTPSLPRNVYITPAAIPGSPPAGPAPAAPPGTSPSKQGAG
jgi:hypothetical protein